MALKAPTRPTYPVDLAIGFVGFFAIMFFIITVVSEITDQPALTWALVLLVLVIVLAVLVRRRSRILRRVKETAPDRDRV
ncbi:hypothetical protein [Lacisediminihabitans profunda]|uniref:Uncharacterized protein n=1 Tax=Lacisediminihabitans profunda TaxID=2594790 RepID=A0A5C8UU75_9MICO|nr:hypothetical protein [Lacisediminihabitans profunda]TXN31186.1 hypothetical protein FVP33_06305 [Lacisediminihabitans profunda]